MQQNLKMDCFIFYCASHNSSLEKVSPFLLQATACLKTEHFWRNALFLHSLNKYCYDETAKCATVKIPKNDCYSPNSECEFIHTLLGLDKSINTVVVLISVTADCNFLNRHSWIPEDKYFWLSTLVFRDVGHKSAWHRRQFSKIRKVCTLRKKVQHTKKLLTRQ